MRREGRFLSAEQLLDQRLPQMEPWVRLWATSERANIAGYAGRQREAIRRWEASVADAEDLSVPSEVIRRRLAAFFYASWLKDHGAAHRNLQAAIPVVAELKDPFWEAQLMRHQALLATNLGAYFEASRLMESAISKWSGLGKNNLANTVRRDLAGIFSELGRHNAALTLMASVQQVSSANRDTREMANARADLGWMKLQAMSAGAIRHDLSTPRELFTLAADTFRTLGQRHREANAIANLALVEHMAGRFDEANRFVHRARTTNPEQETRETRFLNMLEADILLARKNASGARKILNRVLTGTTSATDWTWRAYYGLARAKLIEDRPRESLPFFEAALHDRRVVGSRAAQRTGEATFLADRVEVIQQATQVYLSLDDVGRAFQIDSTGRSEVLRSLDTEVRRLRLETEDRRRFDELVIEYRALQQKDPKQARVFFDEIFEWLDKKVPPEPEAQTAKAVQDMMEPGEAVITFSRQQEGMLSFWLDSDAVLHREVEGPPVDVWSDRLDGIRHLYVVPGDVAAARNLHVQKLADGRALIEAVGVSYLPHAGFLAPRGAPATGKPVVVAVPGTKDTLRYVRREAGEVGDLLRASTVLRGEDAERKTVLDTMQDSRLFHFAGHGVIRLSDPWDAHLNLAGDDRLTLEDLLVERPHIGAAVLNGCETGRGGSLSRREVVGLAEGFLVLGARWVLASAKRIRDDRALAFVRAFYRAGGAARPAEAFRQVALDQIKTGETEWTMYRLFGRQPDQVDPELLPPPSGCSCATIR